MKKQEFIDKLKEALEFEKADITENTVMKDIPNYDSMSVMGIIAFVDEHFSKRVTAQQLNAITTIRSLMELIGMENFSD